MIDLYKKNVWNDAKTVNIISEACFSNVPKIAATALQFFLNSNESKDEDSDDENVPDVSGLKHSMSVNKKTKSRKAQIEKALSSVKRKERNRNKAEAFNFSALHLLNDPQGISIAHASDIQVLLKNSFRDSSK